MDTTEEATWPIKLFRRSLLKQDKLREINNLLGNTEGKTCLDIGGDNGIISYFLRKGGGEWVSADLSPKAIASIGKLVGENSAFLLEGHVLPFEDTSLDVVVIIDYLEHIKRDDLFVRECHRVLKSTGYLIANVPHAKKGSLIRLIHKILGLTDELHGHVRPGYTATGMYHLLKDGFDILERRTYSRFFVQLVDTGIQLVSGFLSRGERDENPSKGVLIDEVDFKKYRTLIRFYALVYPFFWIASKLDYLLFLTRGHALIIKAKPHTWRQRIQAKQESNSLTDLGLR